MTNRLELNWKLDGFVDEQRYYCSLSTINTSSPPPPKVILSGDARSYVDTDISTGNSYHIVVSSVRNGIEKFSAEVVKSTNIYYENNFKSLEGLDVYATAPYVFEVDAVNGGLTFGATTAKSVVIRLTNCPDMLNFTAEFDMTFTRVATDSTSLLFASRTTFWSDIVGNLGYLFGVGRIYSYLIKGSNSATNTETLIRRKNLATGQGEKCRIKIISNGNYHEMYKNGILIDSTTDSLHQAYGGFGFRFWTAGNATVKIENLVIAPI